MEGEAERGKGEVLCMSSSPLLSRSGGLLLAVTRPRGAVSTCLTLKSLAQLVAETSRCPHTLALISDTHKHTHIQAK